MVAFEMSDATRFETLMSAIITIDLPKCDMAAVESGLFPQFHSSAVAASFYRF